jgi:hypothetical protein
MTQWILIIFISSDLWVPMVAFDTEDQCYAALERWDITPPARATCLPGTIEPDRKPRKRR